MAVGKIAGKRAAKKAVGKKPGGAKTSNGKDTSKKSSSGKSAASKVIRSKGVTTKRPEPKTTGLSPETRRAGRAPSGVRFRAATTGRFVKTSPFVRSRIDDKRIEEAVRALRLRERAGRR